MSNSSNSLPSLIGRSPAELAEVFAELGVPERARPMRVAQLWNWLYARGAQDFDAMTVLSKELRKSLAQNHSLARPEIVTEQISADGTRKWLWSPDHSTATSESI